MNRTCKGLVVAALLALAAAGSSARAAQPSSVHDDVTAAVGQTVTLDGEQRHTVVRTQRWYGGGYWQPTPGNVAVSMEIKIEALSKTSYNPMYYSLAGADGETYGRVFIGPRDPTLRSSNNLMAGQATDGWLTFLVSKGALGGLTLVYHMHSGFGSTLSVSLGAVPDSPHGHVGSPSALAGEQTVTVLKVERPTTVGMWKPKSGYAFVTAYVRIRALKATTAANGFSAFTPAGAWAAKPLMGSRSPSLPYKKKLSAGRTVEGWVTLMPKIGQQHRLTLVYHLPDNRDTLLVPLPG